jgi:CheY-like chemotaxis protein
MNKNCTIIWAEDDDDDLGLISEAAAQLGVLHLIDFVSNGEEVINKLYSAMIHKILPKLIVLDNNMPILSGSEVLNRILKFEQLKQIPVVFFTTGKLGPEQHILENHAQLFLKPASYLSYVATIKQILALCAAA